MTPEIQLMNYFIAKADYYKLTLLKPLKEAQTDEQLVAAKWIIATDMANYTKLSIDAVLEFLTHVNLGELLK